MHLNFSIQSSSLNLKSREIIEVRNREEKNSDALHFIELSRLVKEIPGDKQMINY